MTGARHDHRARRAAAAGRVALVAAVVIPFVVWIVQGLGPAADAAQVVSIPLAVASILLSASFTGRQQTAPPPSDTGAEPPGLPGLPAEPPGRRLGEALRRVGHRLTRQRRRIVVLLVLVAVPIAAIIVTDRLAGDRPDDDLLARVPTDLRGDCHQRDLAADPAATATLDCRTADGQQVAIGLYPTVSAMDAAYGERVRRAGVDRGTGDCATATDAEHRYPAVGALTGRVVCSRQTSGAVLAWTDDAARTVAQLSRRDGNDAELYRSWSGLVGIPAFPTAQERRLLDVLPETDCKRVPAGSLDAYPGVVAAIECDPQQAGASLVSYYVFENVDSLRRSYDNHVVQAGSPHGGDCLDAAGAESGEQIHDLRSVDLGRILCHPGRSGAALEWTVEPLRVLGVASGADRADLIDWWDDNRGPLTSAIAGAVNAQAQPPFPTPEEKALLDHVPAPSRVDCMRPAPDQVSGNLPGVTPVAAVACGPTGGAGVVFYYQLADDAALARSYGQSVPPGPDCTTLPPGFAGDAPYSRDGAPAGRLGCSTNTAGPYLAWTHDRLKILVLAFYGRDEPTLLNWWRTDAGPI